MTEFLANLAWCGEYRSPEGRMDVLVTPHRQLGYLYEMLNAS